ncbi:type I-MYXAN CRISPR-associated endonuclease Cas1 [Gemmata sp. JC673]|uniref:CRISPR-associated endonuclease Cas1 n=1 Tax=Gemmata algarum TaxID=2975278 RepID=A0ABU5F8K5_9BACT|nr:type I-MYXAN CRISPR-associated endonuclease Cas1 [Gemmata algarum]MDY3562199.1 type I-MYXAN CRISPR-associated endonuclease Cas1 [Gemmata algarum]
MIPLPVLDSHAPQLRVESLHAWAYCKRLYYFQEIERIAVPHERVFAGRHLHAALEADEDGAAVSVELASERLGLFGKADCLRRRDGSHLPYEHKRGRPARGADGAAEAWPSDRLQVVAYAALIEDAFGQPVPEGRIRYHAANVTVRVPVDDRARADLSAALADARALRESVERPPITENARLCEKCSLAPVCLPEEVRQDREPEREPRRLFPQDRDGATLHVVSQGTAVGVSGDSIVVKPREGPEAKHAIRGVETVLLHGFTQISTQAIRKCVEHGVGVHWLSVSGHHTASTVPTAGQVQRRVRQYKALTDPATCLRLIKHLASAKVEGQYRYLLRATRGDPALREQAQPHLNAIQPLLGRIPGAAEAETVRGLEGAAAVEYFAALRSVLGPQVPEELRAASRSRRPPVDRFNALLSYGYGLLHTAVMRAVLASGLEPALGFFHTPRSAAYPLVLDLLDLFRVTVWDMPLVGSLNRGQWDAAADFEVTRAKVWLSEQGRKKAIGLFEDRMQETWKHPVLNYSLSYARTIELEARLLEKEWTGEPGLFARSRLR